MCSSRVSAPILLLLAVASPLAGAPQNGALTPEEVRDAEVCLPGIGEEGEHLVRFAGGKYSGPGIPFAEMRALAFGELAGEPSAVVEIVWNTGGSGNWEVVARFARAGGHAVCRGVYSPGSDLPEGGTMVARIEIRHDRVHLYGADPLHRRTIAKPLVVPASVFQPCLGR